MKNYKYPTKYELIEVLSSITNRTFLNKFAQERGIFITHISLEGLANEISYLFLDNTDLEQIRAEAYQSNANHALSGFVVTSKDEDFNLKNIYQKVFDEGKFEIGQSVNNLIKITDNIYKGSLEYTQHKAGRIEFMQDEKSSFDFYIEDLGEGSWQVEIDGNRSTDTKELKKLFETVLDKKANPIQEIEQKLLTTIQSIEFFDDLALKGMDSHWVFQDVKQLTLKRGDGNDVKDDNSDEITEIEELVPEEQLVGITQAILHGKGLRENKFVRDSVNSGYRFNAMSYEYQHKTEPFVIQIKAEFKGRPKVFEVSITNYEQFFGAKAESRFKEVLKDSEHKAIRSKFWNNSKEIYEGLIRRK